MARKFFVKEERGIYEIKERVSFETVIRGYDFHELFFDLADFLSRQSERVEVDTGRGVLNADQADAVCGLVRLYHGMLR